LTDRKCRYSTYEQRADFCSSALLPFGATVKSTEKNYLEKYDLGKGKKNQKTEIMFIERCIDFVNPKTGRIGIVLPDGILTTHRCNMSETL
jgi:type I restriction-modification system DNA methylase subunit